MIDFNDFYDPPILDIVTAIGGPGAQLLKEAVEELRWKVRSALDKPFRGNKEKFNLSKDELKAIKSLKNDPTIKILPADKGNCTVVLDSLYYDQMIRELLENDQYIKLKRDPTPKIEKEIGALLNINSLRRYH